jgi:hypothetical protein
MARAALPRALIGVTANQYGPRKRVLANLAPKLSAGAAFVQTNPVFDVAGFGLPAAILARLESGGEIEGWRTFREITEALAASPRIAGVAVMTPEMDAAPAAAQRIAQALAGSGSEARL